MSVLAIIPARGGSKALPKKNILDLGGKPLICWSIEAALKANIDQVIVSTDDQTIAEIAVAYGANVPFIRPKELATDDATRNAVVRHAIEFMPKYDVVVLLQPTSPFRAHAHINEALDLFHKTGAPACVSITKMSKGPYWTFELGEGLTLKANFDIDKYPRRQLMPACYELNGSIYICDTDYFLNSSEVDPFLVVGTVGYEMPVSCSIDIDTYEDLEAARNMLAANQIIF